MDEKILHLKCSGCGACKAKCPVGAISMRPNAEGFLHPYIDLEKCIDCHLCEKICPTINPKYINEPVPKCFAAMADDKIRQNSSSGGIFGALALHILECDGAVCGAAFVGKKVQHIIIESVDDLPRLQSSKYVQSDTRNVYKEIIALLDLGRIVLFTGTPCQIAGLYATVGHRQNLYAVDIICHGTPSPTVYEKYLDELNMDGDFIKTNFRDKQNGWKPALTTTTITTTEKHSQAASKDDFMLAFLKNFCLRKSCGRCAFNKLARQGDLTIGDFWGVHKDYDDKLGTSVILVNNGHGQELLNAIAPKLKLLIETPLSAALPGNPCIYKSTSENPLRDSFFSNINKKTLHENINDCVNKKYDYLCLNFWTSLNYGAVLTAFAAQELLKSLGYSSAHIDYRYPHITDEKFTDSFTDKFAQKYLTRTSHCRNISNFDELNNIATRGFIVGSDQVFRDDYIHDTWYYYLLGFAAPKLQRISLAASFGKNSFNFPYAQKFFSCFDAMSVRENDGLKFLPNAEHILDPVFLSDISIFHKLADSVNVSNDKIVGYILDETDENINDVDINIAKNNLSVEEYLAYIKNAKFFITDSFHGACFAILFNVPFKSIGNTARGNSRFDSLFKMLNISDFDNFDWPQINARISDLQKNGINWLRIALQKKSQINHGLRLELKNNGDKKEKRLSFVEKIFSINKAPHGKKLMYIFGIRIKLRKKKK